MTPCTSVVAVRVAAGPECMWVLTKGKRWIVTLSSECGQGAERFTGSLSGFICT